MVMKDIDNSNILSKQIDKYVTLSSVIGATILFSLNYVHFSNFIFFLGFGILVVPIIFCTPNSALCALFFYIPNERIFKYEGVSRGLIPLYIALLFLRTILDRRFRIDTRILVGGVLLFISMLIANSIAKRSLINTDIIKLILNALMFTFFLEIYRVDGKAAKEPLRWYVLGTFAAILASLIFIFSRDISLLGVRFASLKNDTNYFAVTIALAVSVSLILELMEGKFIYLVAAVGLFIFGVFSVSKGFLVANLGNLFLLIYIYNKKEFKNKKLFFVLALILFALILKPDFQHIIDAYLTRIRVADPSSGRIYIWTRYVQILLGDWKHFLFGLENWDKDLYFTKYGLSNIAHNFLIGALVSYGSFVVLVLVGVYWISYYRLAIRPFHFDFTFLVLLVMLLGYSFLDGFLSNTFQFGFFMFLIIKNIVETEQLQNISTRRLK